MLKKYDIIVVGGGHAGCEAATSAAKLGSSVLLITLNRNGLAQMSCNPAMGGIAKGQIIREIDAMGGLSAIVTDKSMIQFRMLNRSKGPAMWSPRSQNDKLLFSKSWVEELEKISNVDFWEDEVDSIIVENHKVKSVTTRLGIEIKTKAIILTAGTFLNGIIHIGENKFSGGRIGERSSKNLTKCLNDMGFESDRLKTGTPVRVDGRSIDFSKLIEQKGDEKPEKFSFLDTKRLSKQRSCYLAYTSNEVHDVLRKGFEKSPLFVGRIQGIGPRYCPSIEDKIERFSTKNSHQLFIEPEGWKTMEYYVNGFSSSLPMEIQYEALHKIEGFEKAKIFKPGYAIEYDYFPPQQLRKTLETKNIELLYFAGQINGTTGYEEAGAQGLMAGINAHLKINNKEEFILNRSEAYICVLIDDLITKGIDEPYRMFTSRAEYRLLLRQDNADLRLTEKSFQLGLASKERFERVQEKKKRIQELSNYLSNQSIEPEKINPYFESINTSPLKQKVKLKTVLTRPQVNLFDLLQTVEKLNTFANENNFLNDNEIVEETEILIKYQRYIEKEEELAKKLSKVEKLKLKTDFDYFSLPALSYEAREKLNKIKPTTIGQAARISGVSPADISVLLIYYDK